MTVYLFSDYRQENKSGDKINTLIKAGELRSDFKENAIQLAGETPSMTKGNKNGCFSGACPEVNLFDSNHRIGYFRETATTSGIWDTEYKEDIKVLEVKHFSECSEFSAAVFKNKFKQKKLNSKMNIYYYNVLIVSKGNEVIITDLSESDLLEQIVNPFEQGTVLFIDGVSYQAYDIGKINIRRASEKFSEIKNLFIKDEQLRRSKSNFINRRPTRVLKLAFESGEDVLKEYIKGPAGYKKNMNHINNETEGMRISNKVFIVHGHNEEMKQATARLLEKLNLEPIILHEQPNGGRTIIEKFSKYADVSYAIVLLSADDLAYHKSDKPENARFRARQNVILELGYFIGKLGRDKVIALYEKGKDIEIPSDFSGVIYHKYSHDEGWKFQIAKELKSAGFNISLNSIL